MKLPKKKKKLFLALAALAAAAAVGVGIFAIAGSGGEPVNVYPFEYLGMTEYWGDSRESYGPVTTDKIQTVFLTDTQTVTEILVKEGDMVKKGDVLLTFDTTLDNLSLERKRLAVEKLKLQLTAAQEELAQINQMVPMVIPEDTGTDSEGSVGNPDLGTALKGSYQLSAQRTYDGSSPEKAIICWLSEKAVVNEELLETIRLRAQQLQGSSLRTADASASAIPVVMAEEVVEEVVEEFVEDVVEDVVEEEIVEDEVIEDEIVEEHPQQPPVEEPEPPDTPVDPPSGDDPQLPPEQPPEDEPEVPVDPPENVDHFYVIFKVTQGNMSLGSRTVWQGVQVFGDGTMGFSMKFFDATFLPDHTLIQQDSTGTETPSVSLEDHLGSGYTSAQIAQMRSQQEKQISKLRLDIRMAEAEYGIMEKEVSDGHVYAAIDGEVVSVLTEEEAKQTKHPIVKVSDGGGFFIEGSISELEKDTLTLEQTVTINDWNSGMTYEGRVVELGDFPTDQDGWNGIGNPNVSYYPFRVFVEGDADLQEGSYVSVMYAASAAENGIYLEKAFLRTEQGRSYLFLRGKGGKLEKRYVTVGKSLWGSYQEILSGLTEEDWLAFPYGKEVKAGAPTVEADISELYAY